MLCLLARIDDLAKEKLFLLQKAAEKHGVPRRHLHGHITIAVYTGTDEAGFIESCKTIADHFSVFSFRYDHLQILREPSTISACPLKEGMLLELHKRVAAQWMQEMNHWTQSDIWLPHTTLLQDTQADLDRLLQILQNTFEPFEAKVVRLEFSAVRPDGYEIVDFVDLCP